MTFRAGKTYQIAGSFEGRDVAEAGKLCVFQKWLPANELYYRRAAVVMVDTGQNLNFHPDMLLEPIDN